MKTFLITGCAGLIGSNLSHWILDNIKDSHVIGVDNLSGGYMSNMPDNPNFVFYKCGVEDDELNDIFEKHRPDYVCHFAAYAAECLSPFIRKFNYQNNILATANIVNNCINFNVKRLLFTSTMAVYGYGDSNPPFSEELTPAPIDSYGVAKYACETDIQIAGNQHGLDWVILRPHNVFGKFQAYNDRYRNVLGIWMFKKLKNEPITIYGDGEQKRAFSYIDDSLPSFYTALTSEKCSNQIINIGGINEYSINEAAEILQSVVGGCDIVHLEPRHEVKYAYPTYQKSVDLLNFEHKTDLRDGLTKMWEWVQHDFRISNRKLLSFDDYEVTKNIYSYWKN